MNEVIKKFANKIKRTIKYQEVKLKDHKIISRLLEFKEKMIHFGIWEEFINSDSFEYKVYEKLNLVEIDYDLFKIIFSMKRDFKNLKFSNYIIAEQKWIRKIKDNLSKLNVYESFMKVNHDYFTNLRDIYLQKKSEIPEALQYNVN